MKLRIISSGTGRGTIVETEDGQRIENVTKITWTVEVNDKASAVIEVRELALDAKVDREQTAIYDREAHGAH